MPTLLHSKLHTQSKERAQAIVEFAIVLPILMLLLVGILEVGRMIFIYSAVNNASREAARYASAVGLADGGTYIKFQYCSEIRNVARRSTFFMNLTDADIDINYDKGPAFAGSPFDSCPAGMTADTSIEVDSGDRVTVTVRADYDPMISLVPINSRTFTSTSSRTILGVFELGSAASTPGSMTSTPTNPPTNTTTPTILPTATMTATATPGVVYTFTPISCGNVTATNIDIQNRTMSTTISNPNTFPITVTSIRVTWNAATGGTGNPKTLTLLKASLISDIWTGADSSGDLSMTPASSSIPPSSAASLTFTFDKNYQSPSNTLIVLNLSATDCGTFSISKAY